MATRRDLSDGATTVCLTRRQYPEELPHLSTIRLHLYMSLSNFAVDHTRAALRERSEGATIPSLFGRQHLDMLPKVFTTVSKLIMSRKQQFDTLLKLHTSGFKLIMSLSNFVVDHRILLVFIHFMGGSCTCSSMARHGFSPWGGRKQPSSVGTRLLVLCT